MQLQLQSKGRFDIAKSTVLGFFVAFRFQYLLEIGHYSCLMDN